MPEYKIKCVRGKPIHVDILDPREHLKTDSKIITEAIAHLTRAVKYLEAEKEKALKKEKKQP